MSVDRRCDNNDFQISIVVPIYNSDKELSQCLDSIINQSYKALEIILVDDGSTDSSGLICDEYALKDSRIRVIHRKNAGLVSARRLGANEAKFDYISYVDSDDWIEQSMYEELVSYIDAEDVDLLTSNTFMDKGQSFFIKEGTMPAGVYKENIETELIPRMMRNPVDGNWGIVGSAVGKIYKKELLIKTLERIDDRITYGEDDALVFGYIPKCKKIVITDKCFYHYRIHEGSMSTSFDLDSFFKLQLLKEYFEKEFSIIGIWEQQKTGVHQFLLMFLTHAMKRVYGMDIGYQFPFSIVPVHSRVIIYGAGVVGKCYYNTLKTAEFCDVVLWVDKNYKALQEQGYVVEPPEMILGKEYDYVVIAIEGEQNFESIKEFLINIGVHENKIVWKEARLLDT